MHSPARRAPRRSRGTVRQCIRPPDGGAAGGEGSSLGTSDHPGSRPEAVILAHVRMSLHECGARMKVRFLPAPAECPGLRGRFCRGCGLQARGGSDRSAQ